MTSLTPIGATGEGIILEEIMGRELGLDVCGNLVMGTGATATKTPSKGVSSIVGLNIPFNLAISNGVGASANISNITFQVQDCYGNTIAGVFNLDIYLSDSATGVGLTATTPSGGIAAVASSGTIFGTYTTSKAIRAQTTAAGLFVLAVTDTGKTLFVPCANLLDGLPNQAGAALTAASYHA